MSEFFYDYDEEDYIDEDLLGEIDYSYSYSYNYRPRGSGRNRKRPTPYYKLTKEEQLKMKTTDNLYFANYHINDNENFGKVLLDEYRKAHDVKDAVQVNLFIHPNKTIFEFIEILKKKINTENIVVNYNQASLIEVFNDDMYFTLSLVNNGNQNSNVFSASKEFGIELNMFGPVEKIKKIYLDFRKKYILNKPVITWLFKDSDGSINGADFDLVNPSEVYQEYYPYVDDLKTFGQRFMDSSASVLVLYGPPGSGKTSFIRNMLVQLNEGCLSTFDDQIMQSDKLYIRFLNNYHKFLVLEDADTLLLDRETEHNKVMSKILSASDGLVNVGSKKMIFTTNLNDVSKIDEALIRPGRCFDVMHFRRLDIDEASAAAKKMGTTIPDENRKDYSLAELFNAKTGVRKEKFKMGF